MRWRLRRQAAASRWAVSVSERDPTRRRGGGYPGSPACALQLAPVSSAHGPPPAPGPLPAPNRAARPQTHVLGLKSRSGSRRPRHASSPTAMAADPLAGHMTCTSVPRETREMHRPRGSGESSRRLSSGLRWRLPGLRPPRPRGPRAARPLRWDRPSGPPGRRPEGRLLQTPPLVPSPEAQGQRPRRTRQTAVPHETVTEHSPKQPFRCQAGSRVTLT